MMASISERAELINKYRKRITTLRDEASEISQNNELSRRHKIDVPKAFENAVKRLNDHADELEAAATDLENQILNAR